MSDQSVFERYIHEHVSRLLRVGTPRTLAPTECRSAMIPCNQPRCMWELDIEWRDGAHIAHLGTDPTEALLRDHFERVHGIPLVPAS